MKRICHFGAAFLVIHCIFEEKKFYYLNALKIRTIHNRNVSVFSQIYNNTHRNTLWLKTIQAQRATKKPANALGRQPVFKVAEEKMLFKLRFC